MPETSPRGSRASKAEVTEPDELEAQQTKQPPPPPDEESEQPSPDEEPGPDGQPAESSQIPVSQLVDRAPEFLGHASHTAMGALSDKLTETMTVDEAKAKVEEWLQQPVQVDEPDEEG